MRLVVDCCNKIASISGNVLLGTCFLTNKKRGMKIMAFLHTIVTQVLFVVILSGGQLFACGQQSLKKLYEKFGVSEQFIKERLHEWENITEQLEQLDAFYDKDFLSKRIGGYFICDNCEACSSKVSRELINFMRQNPLEKHTTEDFVLEQIEASLSFHFPSKYSDQDESQEDDHFEADRLDDDFSLLHSNPNSPKNAGFLKHSASRKKKDKSRKYFNEKK